MGKVEENSGKGGFRTMPFIIVNESFERVASTGLGSYMIIYMMQSYHMTAATVNTILALFGAFSGGLAIVGAIVSDSYVGRFKAVAIGSISTFIGMFIFWLTSMIPQLTPAPCSQHVCTGPTAFQLAVLFSSFLLMNVGTGFIRPVSIIFGADQLENKDKPDNQRLIDSYFNLYYISLGISSMISVTIMAYIQEHYGWKIGYGVPTVLMFISAFSFLIGSPLYIKKKPKENLFIGLVQAGVAAFRKRNTSILPLTGRGDYYFGPLDSMFLAPSNHFKYLNRACIIEEPEIDLNPDGSASNPWKLCTVEQLESLKTLVRSLPICSTGVMINVTMFGQFSYAILQTMTMDRHIIPQFEIPAASFSVFLIIALTIWFILYDRVLVPLLSKYAGLPKGLSPEFRMGMGLVVSCVSMALSAITESIRQKKAIEQGLEDNPSGLVNMSAMWFVPQYALLGVAEAVYSIGQIEFLYSLLPKSMSTVASAVPTIGGVVASLMISGLVSGVDWLSSTRGKTSWLASNINRGHLDYYFWLITFISLVNFLYFLGICRYYDEGSSSLSHDAEATCRGADPSLEINIYTSKQHQYVDHQKDVQWKPKGTHKSSVNEPGITGKFSL